MWFIVMKIMAQCTDSCTCTVMFLGEIWAVFLAGLADLSRVRLWFREVLYCMQQHSRCVCDLTVIRSVQQTHATVPSVSAQRCHNEPLSFSFTSTRSLSASPAFCGRCWESRAVEGRQLGDLGTRARSARCDELMLWHLPFLQPLHKSRGGVFHHRIQFHTPVGLLITLPNSD